RAWLPCETWRLVRPGVRHAQTPVLADTVPPGVAASRAAQPAADRRRARAAAQARAAAAKPASAGRLRGARDPAGPAAAGSPGAAAPGADAEARRTTAVVARRPRRGA